MDIAVPDSDGRLRPRARLRAEVALRPINVDMDALELGARDASDVTSSYLDLMGGEVLVIVKGEPDERILRERIRSDRKRYKRVPAFGLDEERSLLREFLARQTEGSGRELLLRLVDEPGAFHACNAALKADRALWKLWERFENQGLRTSLLGWMASFGVRPALVLSALADD